MLLDFLTGNSILSIARSRELSQDDTEEILRIVLLQHGFKAYDADAS